MISLRMLLITRDLPQYHHSLWLSCSCMKHSQEGETPSGTLLFPLTYCRIEVLSSHSGAFASDRTSCFNTPQLPLERCSPPSQWHSPLLGAVLERLELGPPTLTMPRRTLTNHIFTAGPQTMLKYQSPGICPMTNSTQATKTIPHPLFFFSSKNAYNGLGVFTLKWRLFRLARCLGG